MSESSLSPDTSPEAERVYFDALRRLGGERRLKMALEMGDTLHTPLVSRRPSGWPRTGKTLP
jgi:hypothetical protein